MKLKTIFSFDGTKKFTICVDSKNYYHVVNTDMDIIFTANNLMDCENFLRFSCYNH